MRSVLAGALLVLTFAAQNAAGASFVALGNMKASRHNHAAALLHDGRVLLTGGTGSPSTAETYDRTAGFVLTGSMGIGRYEHTATTLRDGRVLVAGGRLSANYTNSAEIYDPSSGSFSGTGAMSVARTFHTATLLNDGRVLIVGGQTGSYPNITYHATAEIYDPATGQFTSTGAMATVRVYHTATLLPDGKVLIAGGRTTYVNPTYTNLAEVYDPATGLFAAVSPLGRPRAGHTSTLLPSGLVLIAGNFLDKSTELFDPTSGTFTAGPDMIEGRDDHTATLLPSGKVLVTGANPHAAFPVTSAETYDPATGTFTAAPDLKTGRYQHSATLLPGGEVLIASSSSGSGGAGNAELYLPDAPSFLSTDSMSTPRRIHAATLLPDGKVLVTGGRDANGPLSSAEVYDVATGQFTNVGSMTSSRQNHTATLLRDGRVLVVGGGNNVANLFDPSAGTFTATGSLGYPAPVSRHRATLLADGRVLITGGIGLGPFDRADIYDPNKGTFTQTGSMSITRVDHAAVLLKDGRVLVVGGTSGAASSIAELYDPVDGTFSQTDSMFYARYAPQATLLRDGRVLVTGGYEGQGPSEIFDPVTETFSFGPTTTLNPRRKHKATLLPDGRVLLTGDQTDRDSAEVFDPAYGFAALPNMSNDREEHQATLLPDGRVLITGGVSNGGTTVTNISLVFNPGDGFPASRRPVINTIPAVVCQPATMALTGSGFFGGTSASDGATDDSPGNLPILRLQRVDNDQVAYARPATRTDTTFTSTAVSALPYGHYRAAIWSNGIPSLERVVEISTSTPTILGPYANKSVIQGESTAHVPSFSPVYRAPTTLTVSASAGFLGTLSVDESGELKITEARPVGTYTITVTATTACSTAQQTFSLTVQPVATPTGLVATAASTTFVMIEWNPVPQAAGYELWRKEPGASWALIATLDGTNSTDSGRTANTAYLYRVRAVDAVGGFSSWAGPELATTTMLSTIESGVTIQRAHVEQLRTAAQAARTAAGQGSFSFTDPSLTGVVAKAVHMQQLYTVLADARTALGLSPLGEGTPVTPPNAGALIRASDVTILQNGVK